MIFPIFRKNLSLQHHKNAVFFYISHFSSSAAASASKTLNPSPKSNHIAEYLINSCGFSSQKATTASKTICKFVCLEQATSVWHFFKHHGFTETTIRKLISNHSRILSADVKKTLQPNLQALCEMGFNESELELLVASNTYVLAARFAIPRLEFWQSFLGTNNRSELVSVFRRNRNLIALDIVTGIAPKIALLKEHGLSDADIARIMKKGCCIMLRSSEKIRAMLKKTKEIGFDTKSPSLLLQGLASLSRIPSGTFAGKMEFFRGYGWSEEEFLAAFRKAPNVIHLKEEKIREKMEFLVRRAGCKQSYIVSYPVLLGLSLEKRLKPRHYMLEILKEKNLIERELGLYNIMCCADKNFVKRIILPYAEQVPNFHEIYIAACAGQIPL